MSQAIFTGEPVHLEPGVAERRVALAGPVRLADFAGRYLTRAGAYALVIDGEPVHPSRFQSVTVFPAADFRVRFRAEGGRGFAQIAIAALTIAALAVGASPVLVGLGALAANVLAGVLIPPPSLPVPTRRPDDSQNDAPTLTGAQNAARLGDVIPEIFGRRLVVPDLVGAPWTEHVAGDVARLNLQMAIGMGSYDLAEVRLGNTVVWRDGAATTDAVLIEHLDPGEASTLMPDRVVPAATGRVRLKWVDANTWAGPVVVGPPTARVDRLVLNVEFPGGLGDFTGGGQVAHSVDFRAEYRVIDDAGLAVGPWLCLAEHTETRVTQKPVRFTISQAVKPRRYELRLQVSASQPEDAAIINAAIWDSAYGFVTGGAGAPDYSRLNVRVQNTDEFDTGQAGQVKALVTRKLPSWSSGGGWAAAAATRGRAAAVSHMLRDANMAGLADTDFDLAWLWDTQTDWTSEGDRFDFIGDVRTDLVQALRTALAGGLADVTPLVAATPQAGVLGFFRDVPRTGARHLIGPPQILRGSIQETAAMPVADDFSHVEVEYIDEEVDWQLVSVNCAVDGVTFGDNPRRVRAEGATSRAQAWRYGMHLAASDRYRRRSGEFGVELHGRLLARGDALRLGHPLVSPQAAAGIVLAYAEDGVSGDGSFTLSEDYAWGAGSHYLYLRDREGMEWGPLAVTADPGNSRIAAAAAADIGVLETASGKTVLEAMTGDGQPTPYMLGPDGAEGADVLMMGIAPQGDAAYRVEYVHDDPRVYTVAAGKTPPARGVLVPVPGTPSDTPDVAGINLSIPAAGSLAAEVQVPAGAVKYDIKMTGVAAVESAEPRRTFTSVTAGTYTVEARAFGTAWGDWFAQTITLSALQQAPADLANLAHVGAVTPAAPSVDWDPSDDATVYRVRLTWGSVEKFRDEEGVAGAYSWTAGEMTALNAGYAGVVVEVTPRNEHGEGALARLQLNQPAAPVSITWSESVPGMGLVLISGPVAAEEAGGAAAVQYVLKVNATSGFDPDTEGTEYVLDALPGTVDLGPEQDIYVRFAAIVNPVLTDINWSPEEFWQTAPAPGE